MTAKHKIKINAVKRPRLDRSWRWYIECACGWKPETRYDWPDGFKLWARPNWDVVFALGVAHQKEEQDAARLAE